MVSKTDEEDDRLETSSIASSMSTNTSVQHPLKYSWVLWHYRRSKRTSKNSWMECQKVMATCDTLEEFWRFFIQLRNPSLVRINQDYALFKKGIAPMWEDQANSRGGQWIFIIQKSNNGYRSQIDQVWNEIALTMVGARFKPIIDDLVCGIVFSMRISCFTKISVWVSDYNRVKELLILGHELKRATKFGDCIFFRRNDNMKIKYIL